MAEPSFEVQQIIANAAAKYNVEKALIKAVMRRESAFKPNAVREEPQIGDASIGLMQVLVKTAQWQMNDSNINRQMLFDPAFNVEVGTKYLRYLLNRYSGDLKKAIAAYNAGSAKYSSSGDGSFINQSYVDYVYGWYLTYKDEDKQIFGPMPMIQNADEPSLISDNTGLIAMILVGGVALVLASKML